MGKENEKLDPSKAPSVAPLVPTRDGWRAPTSPLHPPLGHAPVVSRWWHQLSTAGRSAAQPRQEQLVSIVLPIVMANNHTHSPWVVVCDRSPTANFSNLLTTCDLAIHRTHLTSHHHTCFLELCAMYPPFDTTDCWLFGLPCPRVFIHTFKKNTWNVLKLFDVRIFQNNLGCGGGAGDKFVVTVLFESWEFEFSI